MTRHNTTTLIRAHEALPTVHETVVDGVQTFWVDAGQPFVATLMFRVGIADEALATRGITHLVEHLALSQMRDVAHPYNGSVGLDVTTFWAAGAADDVVDFMARLADTLVTLPMARLDIEAGVLIAEGAQRSNSTFEAFLGRRFGPHGPGLMEHAEFGLRRLTGGEVQQWARQHFTADNAVLVLSGPPPESLRLPLPTGSRRALVLPPDNYSFEMSGPTRVDTQSDGEAVGTFGRRSTALFVAARIVAARAQERLRHELGRVYSVGHDYVKLTGDEAYLFWGAGCPPDHTAEVTAAFGAAIEELTAAGPTSDELAHQIAIAEQLFVMDADAVAREFAHADAVAALCEHPKARFADVLAEMHAATPDELAEALSDAMERAMAIATDEVAFGFVEPTSQRNEAMPGRAIRVKHNGEVLRYALGAEAVGTIADGEWLTLGFDELELVAQLADGSRFLVDRRGWWISVPAGTRRLDRLIAAIDERAPRNVVVPAERAK